jgi:hypothetical protein
LCGACAAAVGAAAGTVVWRRPYALAAGDGTWLGITHGLFVLSGALLAELPWHAAAIAALPPLLLAGLGAGLAARPRAWLVVAGLLAVVPGAIAVWLALPTD